jgi:hypothetical protein
MVFRDPKCVFVANDVAQATVVANWLETQSIPAKVMDSMTLGGLEGLNPWTGVSARGIEVWVLQPHDVERARALIEEHAESQSSRAVQDSDLLSRPVLAFCEKCGTTTEFSGEQRETTQECPQCGASMNVSEAESEDEEPSFVRAQHGRGFQLRSLQKPIILFVLGCVGLYLCALVLGALLSALTGR